MFTQMHDIERAFRHIRLFTACFLLACTVISVFVCYRCMEALREAQSRVYVLANGKVLEAIAGDRRDDLAVEARDHIRSFHEAFFTLAPDDQVIDNNVKKALYLADASAKRVYDDMKERGLVNDLISGNVSQEIEVDSIVVNTDRYPYYFRCYATLTITRVSNITLRNLITEGYLRTISRSDHNPHGFLIERWVILDNRDLQTRPRSMNH